MTDKKFNLFGPIEEPLKDIEEYLKLQQGNKESLKSRKARKRLSDELNEVGAVPDVTEDILKLRDRYHKDPEFYDKDPITGLPDLARPNHYILAHSEVFQNSTGIKPLSEVQKDSVRHSQIIIQNGGRIVKAEPRGFGKTSRSTNEGLLGVLQGDIPYLLIICSTTEKAQEIITSILTEILENELIERMYPNVIACFKHIENNPRKMFFQTYKGELTHIYFNKGLIRFPILPGSPCSGAIINIRPKKNVRGIYFTHKSGPFAGKRQRPSHVIFDDVQTDEEAENPLTAAKIVRTIKKSILRSGSHSKRLSYIMACTPISPGDVSHHFLLNEPVQHVIYKMLISRSTNEDMWLGEYARRLLSFDKQIPGSQTKAALYALDYYVENREKMDDGAIAAWEWCYEYEDEPQTEISAIQHAYNIMILEGKEVFESECQCNVIATVADPDITYCTMDDILSKTNHLQRRQLSVKDRFIVSHIDVGVEYLTYVTMSSSPVFEGNIIDYGSHPNITGKISKGRVVQTLAALYKDTPLPEDRIFRGIQDLIVKLATQEYEREDKSRLVHNLILVDCKYQTNYVYKAIRSSPYRNIVTPMEGQGIRAKDKSIQERNYSDAATKYHNCVLYPTPDRTLMRLTTDINYFKTEIHIGFKRAIGEQGSISLFAPDSDDHHLTFAEQIISEVPTWDIDAYTGRKKLMWNLVHGIDNEFLDNTVGCLAGLAMLNVSFDVQKGINTGTFDIQQFINSQAR